MDKMTRTLKYVGLVIGLSLSAISYAQDQFSFHLEPLVVEGLGGIQSYAWGQDDGRWFITGGRLDGLHRRQPWASFDLAGHNDLFWVVDVEASQHWTLDTSTLPQSIREQLRSTNMEFHQDGEYLYIIGGYGYRTAVNDHGTFPYLTAIHIPGIIQAIIDGTDPSPHIRQWEEEQFAVTGGYLNKIGDRFYLSGGQRFEGRYNPMNGPSFIQEYTEQVRIFSIIDDGTDLSYSFFPAYSDTELLHRRDYNVLPQIMPDNSEGLTAFSGVFQPDVDLPFLNCVDINEEGISEIPGFSQYFNHYHCASLPMYDADSETMHNVFFGGIAQYYPEDGDVVMDNEVPFVNTIARVSRDADGVVTEHVLPVTMPGLLGSGAEFIPLPDLPTYPNEVVDMAGLEGDSILIGHIFGGISSSAPNIFWVNDGTQSEASPTIFAVYLLTEVPSGLDQMNHQSTAPIRVQAYPNPNAGVFFLDIDLEAPMDLDIQLFDSRGRRVWQKSIAKSGTIQGSNTHEWRLPKRHSEGRYVLRVMGGGETITQQLVIH
jgi:hypothetical protein